MKLYDDQTNEPTSANMRPTIVMQALPASVNLQMQTSPQTDTSIEFREQMQDVMLSCKLWASYVTPMAVGAVGVEAKTAKALRIVRSTLDGCGDLTWYATRASRPTGSTSHVGHPAALAQLCGLRSDARLMEGSARPAACM